MDTSHLGEHAAAAGSLFASVFVVASYTMRTMIPLRWAALAANALAMVYSFMHGTYPTFALNLVLLPVNAWRLRAMIGLVHDLDASIKGDLNADWLLPYTRPKRFNAGDIIIRPVAPPRQRVVGAIPACTRRRIGHAGA